MMNCSGCGCRPCCDNGISDICRGVNCIASGLGKSICCGVKTLGSIGCSLAAPLCAPACPPPRPCCCNRTRPCAHPPACRCRCVCRCERVCD